MEQADETRRRFLRNLSRGLGVAGGLALLPRQSRAAAPPLTPMTPVQPAPAFALPDLDDETRRLSDFLGRVVIVNFWATWCPPCRKEIPSMERAWRLLKPEGIALLAVHVGGDADTVFRFTADFDITFPILVDKTSATVNAWPVKGLPTTVVVDPRGAMALRAVGPREWDDPDVLAQLRELKG